MSQVLENKMANVQEEGGGGGIEQFTFFQNLKV